ncbi:MAG TPA: biotin/lipoyl-binding protein, partial [Patescibacteria group bacterium]|nr:biotin/lipoyl-binding protein [Patescibacteria group bacterium]
MATVFYKIWKPIAKHKIIASLLVIAAVGYSVYAGTKPTNADTQYILTSVKKGTIVASVSGSGEVAATNQLDLVPQGSGTIVSIKVKAGDQVKQGQVIAVLDQKNAFVSLKQAQASVDSAKANLEKVQAGTASTDIQTAQNSVNAAQESLTNAEQNLTQVQATQDLVVKNAYTNMMNAGLAPAAGASNRTTAVPTIAGAYTGTDQGSYKISLYQTEAGLHYSVSGLETGDGLFSPGMIAIGTHGLYLNFPAGNYFDGDYWTIDIPNLKSSTYLSASNAYETAKQSRISAEQTAQNQIDTATLNLQQTQTALAAKMTPPNPADVAAAKAQVDSALVQLQNAQNNYQNTIVKAPFDGKIASVNVQAGSQAGASTSIATLITNQLYASIP